MSINYETLGKRIKEIRKRNNLSQAKMSEMIEKNPSYVSYIESGVKSMSLDTFVQIANALSVPTDLLLIDHLVASQRPASKEITALLADCSDYEVIVILDTMKSLKTALREHQAVSHKRPVKHLTSLK